MSVTTAAHRPTVTHPDTWRDKKKTARRAAFPQQAGRFRRWWQVLGSNQRRLSRRFYRPLPLGWKVASDLVRSLAGRVGEGFCPTNVPRTRYPARSAEIDSTRPSRSIWPSTSLNVRALHVHSSGTSAGWPQMPDLTPAHAIEPTPHAN